MVDKVENFFLKIIRKIGLGKLADIYEEHKEGMRYIVFGVFTTLVNMIISALFYYLILRNLSEGIKVNVSNIIAIIAAWLFAYVTNKIYVFDSKTTEINDLIREIISFVGCRAFAAVVEIGLMYLFVTIFGFDFITMKIIVNIIVIIINFVFSKLIIFKKNDNTEEQNKKMEEEENG